MANPLAILRRHQKVLLAVFGVIIMFVFVIGSGLDEYVRGRGSAPQVNPTIVKWKYGELNQQDLSFLQHKHDVTMKFLEEVVKLTQERKGTPRVPNVTQDQFGQIVPGLRRSNTPADFIQTLVLAKKAEQLGIVVDDKTVFEFLGRLSDGKLDDGDFATIIENIPNRHLTSQQIFDELRLELSAQYAWTMARNGLVTTSPASAWQLYNRLHHRVQAEVFPVAVDDFLGQVADPGEKELVEFFDKHKTAFSFPASPEPGFRQRKRAAFEYLKFDLQPILDAEKKKLTEEELRKEYDTRVSRGEFKVPVLPQLPTETPPTDAPPTEKPATEGTEDTEKPAEKPTEKPADKPDGQPSEKPAEAPAEKPAEKPAEQPAEKPEQKPDNPPAEGNNGGACQENPENAAEKPTEKPSTENPSPEKPAEKPADEKPAEEKPAAEKPAEEKPAEKPADEKPAETPPEEKPAEAKPAAEPPKVKPFEEVRDEIATSLARPRAEEIRKKSLEEARRELDDYARWYRGWELYKDTPEAEKVEKRTLDAQALADRLQVTYGKTPMMDGIEIQDHELGKCAIFSFNMGFSQISFSEIAYRDNLLVYKPDQIPGEDPQVEFLYWKIEEKEGYVPELKEVRDQVVTAWKRQKAIDLARKAAEEKAQSAEDKPSLKEALGEGVLETNEFSWMTAGAVPFSSGAPSISRVQNVDMAGNDFMSAVFKLKPGQMGVAVNNPKTIVYVVRITSASPSEEVLRQRFLMAGTSFEVAHLAAMEAQMSVGAWFESLQEEMNVTWVNSGAADGTDE